MLIYLQLFISFFKIGLFGFGGGYAMLSLIQHEVVETNHWMTVNEFTDIVAVSQMTPGPIGINCATYVGYTASGNVWGSIIATFAVSLPSFILMLIIARSFIKFRKNKYVNDAFKGLRPAIVGLIAAAALQLMNKENFIDYSSVVLFLSALFLIMKYKVHPMLVIVLAGVAGWFIY